NEPSLWRRFKDGYAIACGIRIKDKALAGAGSEGRNLSRSVRDSALMLDCTAGPEPGDPYAAPMQKGSFLEAIARPPRKLRIALMLKDHRGARLHPECLAAISKRGQAVRQPWPHRRGGGPRTRHGGAAAIEWPDLGGQYRPLMQHAVEGAGTR